MKFAEILGAPSLKNSCKRLLLQAEIMLHEKRVRCIYILTETDAATVSVLSVLRENHAINLCSGKRRIITDTRSLHLYHLVILVLTGKTQKSFLFLFQSQ